MSAQRYVVASGNPWRVKRFHVLQEVTEYGNARTACSALFVDAEVHDEPPKRPGLTLCPKCAERSGGLL